MDSESYDVAIVGGGGAGLSAALVLGRARRSVAVVDAGTTRNAPAAHMQGFLSRDGMPPGDFLAAARAEVRSYGVELVEDRVVEIATGFTLRLAGGRRVTARRLLLASGAVDELPELPGARERWGRDLLHCPYCHGWEVRDLPIGVLGTGPGSVDHAHLLRQWSDDVVFFAHDSSIGAGERAALAARGILLLDGRVARLSVVDDRLDAVELEDGRRIPRAAVFIRPALRPRDAGLVGSLGCELDEGGFPRVDATGLTSVSGVWAAGNASNPRAQVITAAGEGSAAAIAINADLVAEDVRDAVDSDRSGGSSARRSCKMSGMERVLGIGGTFVRASDPAALSAWYRDCLGLDADEHGLWQQEAGPTVFAAFESDTDYFGSRVQQTMLNFRVSDLDAMLAQLRAKGADVAEEVQDMEGVGRFGWVTDPEGNRIELWQPA